MPLVKGGRTSPTIHSRGGRCANAGAGSVLVPAARFLADPCGIARAVRPVGVIWPNDKNISELAPYLDKLALIALVFPVFRDGRAYSQARLLRERYGYRGEMRATGQVLRDQFLFLLRAGFDSFDVVKDADAASFEEAAKRYRYSFSRPAMAA